MERQFTGTVIRTTGSWYDVRTDAGETVKCRIRGRLRLKGCLLYTSDAADD